MKKRVLFVISSELNNAGVPAVTMGIVENLNEYCQFDIIVSGTDAGYYDSVFLSYGGKIFRTPNISYLDHKLGVIKRGRIVYEAVINACNENSYDIIHCENGFESGYALRAAKICGIPLRIVHSHGTYKIKGKNILLNLYKLHCKGLIDKYSTVRLACSNVSGRSLFKSSFINILNPVDVDYYSKISKEKHESINLLQIGYYCNLKNQIFSLKVLSELLNQGANSHLYYIGFDNGSGYYQKLQKNVHEMALESCVTFLPSDYPKNDILGKIDFLLLPSTNEGLPLVVLEAQAANVHSIISDVVTTDVDFGLCSFLPISNACIWVREILDLYGYNKVADKNKLEIVNKKNYMNQIKNAFYKV